MAEISNIAKSLALALALLMAISSSSLLIVKPASAQSIIPSPPQFRIETPNNNTIQLVIKNQAFTNSGTVNSIVYYYRIKTNNGWDEDGDYTLQSNSDATVISIPPEPSVPDEMLSNALENSTSLDFQVQAVSGFYNETWEAGYMPGMPPIGPGTGYWQITFTPAESSAWSPTQTMTLPANFPSSPAPTQSPSIRIQTPVLQTPARSSSNTSNTSLLLTDPNALTAIVAFLAVIVAAIVYTRKRRQRSN
ncbi:MAG TPA: hypothetical protein VK536_03365 [Candidatus Limnocylindrales bacterium]|nr:hypothetical protein [Candidatus Limnocylindrales bacterium]